MSFEIRHEVSSGATVPGFVALRLQLCGRINPGEVSSMVLAARLAFSEGLQALRARNASDLGITLTPIGFDIQEVPIVATCAWLAGKESIALAVAPQNSPSVFVGTQMLLLDPAQRPRDFAKGLPDGAEAVLLEQAQLVRTGKRAEVNYSHGRDLVAMAAWLSGSERPAIPFEVKYTSGRIVVGGPDPDEIGSVTSH